MFQTTDFVVIFTDGSTLPVQATTRDQARNRAYKINRGGVIADIVTAKAA